MTGWLQWPNPPGKATAHAVIISSYDLFIDSLDNDTSSVTLAEKLDFDPTGMILRIDDFPGELWQVSQDSSGDAFVTSLSLTDYTTPADGIIFRIPTGGFMGFGQLVTNIFRVDSVIHTVGGISNYSAVLNDAGVSFDMRNYLDAHAPIYEDIAVDETKGLLSDGLIMRYLRSIGISCKGTYAFNMYRFNMKFIDTDPVNVVFNDGHTELISETNSNDICSKVYVSGNDEAGDFYLAADGTIFTYLEWLFEDYEQMPGNTRSIVTSGDMQTAAAAIFAENKHSHKIAFASDKDYHVGQQVNLYLDRWTLKSVITSVEKISNDDRTHYTCGSLPSSASDKIRASSVKSVDRMPIIARKGQMVFTKGK